MAAATLLELLSVVAAEGRWRWAGNTLLHKPPAQLHHRQTMRGDSLHSARLFETKEANREWRVCASRETQYPLSPGGFGQTSTVPRGGVHLLGSTAEVGVPLFTQAKKLWHLQERQWWWMDSTYWTIHYVSFVHDRVSVWLVTWNVGIEGQRKRMGSC